MYQLQIRMGAISQTNVNFVGSHCGVSIGEDGPSQMALEDLALFRSIPGTHRKTFSTFYIIVKYSAESGRTVVGFCSCLVNTTCLKPVASSSGTV